MIKSTKTLYTSIISFLLGGGSLCYYLLTKQGVSLSAQPQENVASETIPNSIDVVNDVVVDQIDNQIPTKEEKKPLEKSIVTDIKFTDGDDGINRSVADKYPEGKSKPYLIEQAEQHKKEDPVFYRWHGDNPFQKKVEPSEAKEKLNVLMDHTLMLSYSRGCPLGTAGILDYVLPEGNQKYPTRFFIASDAHVVNKITFDQTNPYQQSLPNPKQDFSDGWKGSNCYELSRNGEEITLIKEKVRHEDSDFDKSKGKDTNQEHKNKELGNRDYKYDLSFKGSIPNHHRDPDHWQFTLKRPKLVYFPHNYIKNKNQEHVADFAIFEVDFRDENAARLFTRNFYGKYDRHIGTHRNQALNLFAEPLHKKYTNKQLLEEDLQVYMVGYPSAGMHHKASTNYNINRKSASRMAYAGLKGEDDKYGLGHAKAGANGKWAGKLSNEIGYAYAFSNPEISRGASGAMVTTENGDVLGVYTGAYGNIGGATPLRNMEIKDKNGKVIFDEYDFIEGAKGQNGSYKEQIQKYVLKEGKQTSLSKLRNGGTI